MSAQSPQDYKSSGRGHDHKSSASESVGQRRSSARIHKSDASQDGGRPRDAVSPLSKPTTAPPPDAPSSEQPKAGPATSFPAPASSSTEQPAGVAASSSQGLPLLVSPSGQPGDVTGAAGQVPPLAVSTSQQPHIDVMTPIQDAPASAVSSSLHPEDVPVVLSQVSQQATYSARQPADTSAISVHNPPMVGSSSKLCDSGPAFLPALAVPPPLVSPLSTSIVRRPSALRRHDSRTSTGRSSYNAEGSDMREGAPSPYGYHSSFLGQASPPRGLAKYFPWLDTKTAAALACIVVIAAAILATMMAYTGYNISQGGWLCMTLDCTVHRNLLDAVLNESVDPCHDFEAFVCPRHWAPPADAYGMDISIPVHASMRQRWLDSFGDLFEDGKEYLDVVNKAAAMYDSCLTDEPSTENALKQFMDMLKLPSADQLEPVANVFGVLMNVAYNWQAPLWFRVTILPRDAYHPFRRVLITRNPQMAQWLAELDELNGTDEYRKRWSQREGLRTHQSAISRIYETRRAIFRMFLSKRASARDTLRAFSLSNASSYVNFASDMVQVLNEHLRPDRNLSKEDLMIFEEAHLHDVINAAFARFQKEELMQHVLWLFMDVYGPISEPSLLLSQGHGPDVNKTRLRYCSSQVEASYHLLLTTLFVYTQLTPLQRLSIGELIRGIYQNAVQLIRDSDWLEWRSKSLAIAKLENLDTSLFPPDEFFTEDDLSNIYHTFPENASSFMEYWIKTRKAIRNYATENPITKAELLGAPGSYGVPVITYIHALNVVFISMAALSKPLFYLAGTQAVNYGGLGFQYAREIVRALDSTGVGVDAYGNIVHPWISGQSAAEYQKRVACLGAVDNDIFPDVPALELAYKAYIASMEKEGPKIFERVSEKQIFFITMCLGMCRHQQGPTCNKAVMAFQPFAEAFNCDWSSQMNLKKKCTFFQ